MPHTVVLRDAISQTTNNLPRPSDVNYATIAFIGKLPSSSLLRLALNHVERESNASITVYAKQSDKARGKQRRADQAIDHVEGFDDDDDEAPGTCPSDNGSSQEAVSKHVLILTPDLAALRKELAAENDSSLFGRPRDAPRTASLAHISFKHLPSSAHLNYFLASCYHHSNPKASELHSAYTSSDPRSKQDPSYVPSEPTMVILHSPSSYLAADVLANSGIEGYAATLALFISAFSNSAKSSPCIVLFDPMANEMTMPTIPTSLTAISRKRPRLSEQFDPNREVPSERELDKVPLRRAIDRFFDSVAECVAVPLSPNELEFGHLERWRMDVRSKKNKSSYDFIEFTTRRVREGDDDHESGEEEAGTLKILIEK